MDWAEYFMGFANHAARKSKDSTQVGAALIGPEGEVRLTSYNGPPRGVRDLPERRERPMKYLYASHAEANLISFAAREGIRTKDCRVYVTHLCCAGCARSLIQAGVVEVVAGPGKTSMPPEEFEAATTMFHEAGVKVGRFAPGETPFRCRAVQYSDSMVCDACALQWDTNDPDLPKCGGPVEVALVASVRGG